MGNFHKHHHQHYHDICKADICLAFCLFACLSASFPFILSVGRAIPSKHLTGDFRQWWWHRAPHEVWSHQEVESNLFKEDGWWQGAVTQMSKRNCSQTFWWLWKTFHLWRIQGEQRVACSKQCALLAVDGLPNAWATSAGREPWLNHIIWQHWISNELFS